MGVYKDKLIQFSQIVSQYEVVSLKESKGKLVLDCKNKEAIPHILFELNRLSLNNSDMVSYFNQEVV